MREMAIDGLLDYLAGREPSVGRVAVPAVSDARRHASARLRSFHAVIDGRRSE